MRTLDGIPIANYESDDLTVRFYHMAGKNQIYAVVRNDSLTNIRSLGPRQTTLKVYKNNDGTHYVRTCRTRITLEDCEVPEIRLRDGFNWIDFLGED